MNGSNERICLYRHEVMMPIIYGNEKKNYYFFVNCGIISIFARSLNTLKVHEGYSGGKRHIHKRRTLALWF